MGACRKATRPGLGAHAARRACAVLLAYCLHVLSICYEVERNGGRQTLGLRGARIPGTSWAGLPAPCGVGPLPPHLLLDVRDARVVQVQPGRACQPLPCAALAAFGVCASPGARPEAAAAAASGRGGTCAAVHATHAALLACCPRLESRVGASEHACSGQGAGQPASKWEMGVAASQAAAAAAEEPQHAWGMPDARSRTTLPP